METSEDTLSPIKLFLVESTEMATGESYLFVATMISAKEYLKMRNESQISWLYKGNFSGIIIYSDVYGTYQGANVYEDGLVIGAGLVTDTTSLSSDLQNYFIGIVSADEITKSTDALFGGTLIECYCVAEDVNGDVVWEDNDDDQSGGYDFDSDDDSYWPTGGGGGGSSGGGDNSGIGTLSGPQTDRLLASLTVQLSASSGGTTVGSGTYAAGSTVIINASSTQSGFYFSRWVGDLKGRPDNMTMIIEQDIISTAYFIQPLHSSGVPCIDSKTGRGNPLVSMTLAKPSENNIMGATFGYTRNQGAKPHYGIDFYAEVGTPIFAMYDGVISQWPYVISQPDKNTKEYPANYVGDTDNSGNRIYIQSNIYGNNVTLGYWHLQAGNPIGINPRTGSVFSPGDIVYQGDIIGYVGRTGNAYNVDYTHLHLCTKINGVWVDPAQYVNGIVSSFSENITGIKCD